MMYINNYFPHFVTVKVLQKIMLILTHCELSGRWAEAAAAAAGGVAWRGVAGESEPPHRTSILSFQPVNLRLQFLQ